jgi:2-phospho-L-lactate guanylyltransferase (CobY/MobA/RfbA family)
MANETYNPELAVKIGALKYLAQRTDKRLDALEAVGAQANVIETVQVNGSDVAVSDKKVNITVPTKVSDLSNDSSFQSESQVNAAIKAAVAGSLQPAGSVTFAELPALSADNVNKIYNVTDAFTTTTSFAEGKGVKYPAGTNVAIINVGSADSPSYVYDAYTGVIDTSGFAEKVKNATEDDIVIFGKDGAIGDSGKKLADFVAAESGKGLSANDFTDTLKNKLDGITEGATKVEASTTNGNIVINGTEKTVYTHDTHTEHTSGLYKVTVDGKGHVTAAEAVVKKDITDLGVPAQDTTYNEATTSAAGLMSSTDKSKLDGITFATDDEVKAMLDEVYGAETTEG